MKRLISLLLLICMTQFYIVGFSIENEPLLITKQDKILKSELKKEYSGIEYTIKNTSNNKLNIVNAQIVNGTSGNIAVNATDYSAGKSVGLMWAVMGPVGLFTLGIGWILGIVATPIILITGNQKLKKMKNESYIYTDTIPLGFIQPQESISVLTLVPFGVKAQMKLTVLDENTKQTKVINF